MDDLLVRIQNLEKALASTKKFIWAHHKGTLDTCEDCLVFQGKPVPIGKKQVSRLFDVAAMLDRADPPRTRIFRQNLYKICQTNRFDEITQDQWPEVEKIVVSIEAEMKELGIEPIKKPWSKK